MASTDCYDYYGVRTESWVTEPAREIYMLRKGGKWTVKGRSLGNGTLFHFKELIRVLWPEVVHHRWFNTFVENWLLHKFIAVLGPKNSGKSLDACVCHLADYYCWPECTTTLVCSTTKERLEDRIWGEIKKFHRAARSRFPGVVPGHLIEGRQRIVTDDRDEAVEGRDFRNGLMGVPCLRGDRYVGISAFQGIKNKRVRLCGDELAALPKTFVDAIATLDVQGDVKVTGMGNPAQTTDALGLLAEPHTELGGWEGGIDQSPKTKTWKTRFDDGICIQFPGSDSPNLDETEAEIIARGGPKYPFLISREQMEKDMATWGKDDWHYTMFDEGRMPRGQGSHRVITRQLCLKHHAMEEPVWLNTNLQYVTALDAAYRAVGGDRCVFMRLAYGLEAKPLNATEMVETLVNQTPDSTRYRTIIALLDTFIIPIQDGNYYTCEDQIVMFCKQKHDMWHLPPDVLFFDAGMRTSLVTAFARLWSPKVNSIDFGGKPPLGRVSADIDVECRDYYDRFVTYLWWSSRLAIESEQLRGLSEDIVQEGCTREWKQAGSNKISVETKKEMKTKSGRSPDLYDCLVTALEGARQKGFVISRLGDPNREPGDNRWKRELIRKAREFQEAHQLIYTT